MEECIKKIKKVLSFHLYRDIRNILYYIYNLIYFVLEK